MKIPLGNSINFILFYSILFEIGHKSDRRLSSIVLLEFNTVDPSKGFSAPILKVLKQISSRHM